MRLLVFFRMGNEKNGPDGGTADQKLHRVHLTKLLTETKLGHGAHRKTTEIADN